MQLPIEWLPLQGEPEQLMLLLHGVGASGADMAPLAQALRAEFPQAALLAPDAPQAFNAAMPGHPGRQWFDAVGANDDNRDARVSAALPPLLQWVAQTQQRLGVAPAATALVGFAQGGTMALQVRCRPTAWPAACWSSARTLPHHRSTRRATPRCTCFTAAPTPWSRRSTHAMRCRRWPH